jgi:hypothetical protein
MSFDSAQDDKLLTATDGELLVTLRMTTLLTSLTMTN